MGERPAACETLAGPRTGGQINGAEKRFAASPHEMTTEPTPRSHAAEDATPRRAEEPPDTTARFRACHGPCHEIVKKPFATPGGGKPNVAACARRRDERRQLSGKSTGPIGGRFPRPLRRWEFHSTHT